MTFNMANVMKAASGQKLTENGAIATSDTGSNLLNLFGVLGSLRNREPIEIVRMYEKALEEDFLLGLKMAFYSRNCRGGLGERDTARTLFTYLAFNHTETMHKNFLLIPSLGRWDDMYLFVGSPLEDQAFAFMYDQFMEDWRNYEAGSSISLLAKWLKSANASSEETRMLGRLTAQHFGFSERRYRKMLSALRDHLIVVERQMSLGEWEDIDYPSVPSYAMKNYRKAFSNHDEEGFTQYIESLKKGKTKINSSVLFPYDLVHEYWNDERRYRDIDEIIEAQWKALPNYVEGEQDIIIMADVSGSMSGRPMETSVGLATYFAERNQGPYKNLYMTFSRKPKFIDITKAGSTLRDKLAYVEDTGVGYNTNLEAAFQAILDFATMNYLTQEQLPAAMIVLSDMEIDKYASNPKEWTFMQTMRNKFAQFGYTMPKIVMWNVEARQNTYLGTVIDKDVSFFSGQSASVFKDVLDSIHLTAYEAMVKTLSNPVYDCIRI